MLSQTTFDDGAEHDISVVVSRGFGYGEKDSTEPTSADAAMSLGGLSTPVITASIRSLLSKRKVDESTSVQEVIPR